MTVRDQILGQRQQRILISAAIGKESWKHEDNVHRQVAPLVGGDNLRGHQVVVDGDRFLRRAHHQ